MEEDEDDNPQQQQNFEFVHLSRPSDQQQRGVRSHVRSKAARYWNNERRRQRDVPLRTHVATVDAVTGGTRSERHAVTLLPSGFVKGARWRPPAADPRSISVNWVDHCASRSHGTPEPSSEQKNFLFDHFVNVFAPYIGSIDSSTSVAADVWVQQALIDRTAADGLYACAAIHRFVLNNEGYYLTGGDKLALTSRDVLFYRGRLLRSINAKLQDQSQESTDVALLSVVAMLAFECMSNNHGSVAPHLNALSCMIGMRGGLDKLPKPLAALVLMGITRTAIMTWQHPLLSSSPSFFTLDLSTLLNPSIINRYRSLGERLFTSRIYHLMNSAILSPVNNLRNITIVVAAIRSGALRLSPEQQRDIVYARSCAENELISASIDYASSPTYSASAASIYVRQLLVQATRLALLIYSAVFLNQDYPGARPLIAPTGMRALTRRLLKIVHMCRSNKHAEVSAAAAFEMEPLFWICTQGAVSDEVEQRQGFLEVLKDLRWDLGVANVLHASVVLEKYLFVEAMHGEYLRDVWMEVQEGEVIRLGGETSTVVRDQEEED